MFLHPANMMYCVKGCGCPCGPRWNWPQRPKNTKKKQHILGLLVLTAINSFTNENHKKQQISMIFYYHVNISKPLNMKIM